MFRIVTGTIFSDSPIKLLFRWFLAVYLDTSQSKRISIVQLAQTLGVKQQTAWYRLQRIRHAAGTGASDLLGGEVEVDETYIGGKDKTKQASKWTPETLGRSARTKAVAFGVRGRGGRVIAFHVEEAKASDILPHVTEQVARDSSVHADEWASYTPLANFYSLSRGNHQRREYVRGKAHANSIESVWALVKRIYVGIQHFWSIQHTQRYLKPRTFRLNHQEDDSMEACFSAWREARLTYKALIACPAHSFGAEPESQSGSEHASRCRWCSLVGRLAAQTPGWAPAHRRLRTAGFLSRSSTGRWSQSACQDGGRPR